MLADTKTTHRTQALAKGSNDKINLVQYSLGLGNTTTTFTIDTEGVCFIDQ